MHVEEIRLVISDGFDNIMIWDHLTDQIGRGKEVIDLAGLRSSVRLVGIPV